MKWKFKMLLLKIFITILALFIAMTTVKAYIQPEPVRIVQQEEIIQAKEYIIDKQMIMSKLKQTSQIVSFEQSFENDFTKVDDGLFGERHTELSVKGTYIMGLNTSDIEVTHIDENGIVHIKLGDPTLISLDIPFDNVEFEKTNGFFRLAMSEEEQKTYYKSIENDIRNKIINDKQVIKTAELFNEDVVRDILKLIPNVKDVIFE